MSWRYPDGSTRATPPARVDFDGFIWEFSKLNREQWDTLGYNETVPVTREPFTTYETVWEKGEDYIYREVATSMVVDETAKTEYAANAVRTERNRLLLDSDWTQLADCPLADSDKATWATYRQELREVPQQSGFPDAVEWPAMPEE